MAIYALDPVDATADRMTLRAMAGYSDGCAQRIGAPFNPKIVGQFDDLVKSTKSSGWGRFSEDPDRRDPIDDSPLPKCIDWPVPDKDGKTVALLRADGEHCSKADLETMKAYAEEVLATFEESKSTKEGSVTLEAERCLVAVDNRLQTMRSPEDALRFLLERACEFTNSYSGHVRERRGNEVVILRLGPKGYDGYERLARAAWPLTHRASWSARTVVAGAEQMQPNLAELQHRVISDREHLSKEAVAVLEKSQSFCFEPLVFENRCIGAIGFHSDKLANYTEDRLWFLRQIARRASLALHDLKAKREAEERLENVKVDTVLLLLHNINNPLAVLWNRLDVMRRLLGEEPVDVDQCREMLEAFGDGCGRISRIREDLGSLLQPVESARTEFDLHELIRQTVDGLLRGRDDIETPFVLASHLDCVTADELAIRTCLETLAQNALDEFDKLGGNQRHCLTVSLRDANEDETALVPAHDPCLIVEVQDNGPGVPAEMEQNLFTVVRSRKSSGLGIGLAKCRGMARAAGGEVYLDRAAQPGAKFVLLMPYSPHQGESDG